MEPHEWVNTNAPPHDEAWCFWAISYSTILETEVWERLNLLRKIEPIWKKSSVPTEDERIRTECSTTPE